MEKIREYRWVLKGKNRICHTCSKKILIGTPVLVEVFRIEKYYPVKGPMVFTRNYYHCCK